MIRKMSLGLAALLLAIAALGQNNLAQPAARPAPAWLRSGVVYEIFPRNFSATGDFNGITARLDELRDLGVNVLWLMPIHPIGEQQRKGTLGSPYAVKDYYAINPDYGTTNDFRRLVTEAHRRKLKVILDLVANHTAWDSVMMQHRDFYKQDAQGHILPPVPEWSDVAGLNYASPELRQYMIRMLTYWVRDFGVDGFRCDVAYMVPTDFWEQARTALEQVKPDIMLLAEASKPELLLKAFDADYSWPLHATLNRVLIEGAPASQFEACWEQDRREFPPGALHLRISDNHDEARAVARFGIRGALAAEVLMLTLDGVPLLYNGMEVGDATESGDPALFEKMPIFWRPKERPPLRDIYRGLIQLRRSHAAFQNDRVVWLRNSAETSVVTFERADGREQFIVVINFSNRPVTATVQAPAERDYAPVKIAGQADKPDDSFPQLHLGPFEWRLYRNTPSQEARR
ncbi:MAG TPA: alpha-amylase family glycosyl hydrolase [Verrucomicrobiae bacterium]|nr:alpha-amylase family glycosyl hydrolase [Verrucomicrobiae bacterium]